jgi:periplasmic divalent cation tolerance protein
MNDSMPDAVIAVTTCPDAAVAKSIAETLVVERLATCVNRIEGIRSTYVWEGHLQDDGEVLLIIKTVRDAVPALQQRLLQIHPYELPELIVLGVQGGSAAYLDWVRAGVLPTSCKP